MRLLERDGLLGGATMPSNCRYVRALPPFWGRKCGFLDKSLPGYPGINATTLTFAAGCPRFRHAAPSVSTGGESSRRRVGGSVRDGVRSARRVDPPRPTFVGPDARSEGTWPVARGQPVDGVGVHGGRPEVGP